MHTPCAMIMTALATVCHAAFAAPAAAQPFPAAVAAQTDSPVPGTGGTIRSIESFPAPAIDHTGRVVFNARLQGPGVDTSNDLVTCIAHPDGTIEP